MTKEEYLKNPNKCLNCNKDILPKEGQVIYYTIIKKFCCNLCSTSYNNKLRGNKKFCLYCGKEIIFSGKKYCNHECFKKHSYEKYIMSWKSGEVDGMRGEDSISLHIKRYLFEKYNNKCCKCGWNEINPYTNKIPLEIEHIDGNYKNNREENLILLCPNCHSLTSTYKGANRGNGRSDRKKYT